MFLHMSVILFTGGVCVCPSMQWECTPGRADIPSTHSPRQTPPGQTPLKRVVRILLECILVITSG